MSRSYHKSNNLKHAYINWVCYFSNKEDKKVCNRLLRRISRYRLKKALSKNDLDNYSGYIRPREVRDVWDFASDGLKFFISFINNPGWTEDDIKREIRK